jgi:homoserine acetyltransferase
MGGQQAFRWCALYSDVVEAIAPIFGSAKTSAHNVLLLEGAKAAMTSAVDFRYRVWGRRPPSSLFRGRASYAHLLDGDPEQALHAAMKATQVSPQWRPAWEVMVFCLAELGRMDDARRQLERLRSLDTPPSDVLEQLRLRNPGWAQRMASALTL